jgi:hypothetical protein
MILRRFDHNSYAFVRDVASAKPIAVGMGREEWFSSGEEAKEAARESGYWIDGELAREH